MLKTTFFTKNVNNFETLRQIYSLISANKRQSLSTSIFLINKSTYI